MAVTFKSKSIPMTYKIWTTYKLFQLLAIIKIWGSTKLNEMYFLIYILDNEICVEDLEQNNFLLFSNYFSNKIIDFSLKNNLISFSRLSLRLNDSGENFFKESKKLNVFNDLIEKIKELKKQKKLIKKYLENRENLYAKD
ncbi:hypothetical protein [Fusobacterium ulcerans]|uniref:hypothetical protein n=1 Tax=Fusobacterium TaxID=848 RepID=UPI0030996756